MAYRLSPNVLSKVRLPLGLFVGAGVLSLLNSRFALPVAIFAAALVMLEVIAPSVSERVRHFAGEVGRVSALAVSTVLSTLGLVLGVIPIWLTDRLFRRERLEALDRTGATVWVWAPSQRSPDGSPLAPERPAALANSGNRSGVGGLLFVTLAILVVSAVLMTQGETESPKPAAESQSRAAVIPDGQLKWDGLPIGFGFEKEPWARDLFREQMALTPREDLILGSRNTDFQGKFINIENGRRVTWTPPHPEVTVWYFGGSTMFGIGQRDDYDIPSIIAKQAFKDGLALRSLNFGVSADVNWIETIRFAEQLSSTADKPDLVVFYDGSNEIGLGYERLNGGNRSMQESDRRPLSEVERQRQAERLANEPPLSEVQKADLATKLSAAQYRRGVLTARALAANAGVPVVHFWQPQPFARRLADADKDLYSRLDFPTDLLPASTAAYETLRRSSGVDPIDLSGVFDGIKDRLYFDGSHTNERGARIVAEAIYKDILPILKKAA